MQKQVEIHEQTYNFKGTTEDIINSILSLLFGKDFYRESTSYSNFLNNSQPEAYRKKIKSILDLMQKENLILVRETNEEGGSQLPNTHRENGISKMPSASARIYLRQHGKDILSLGGYKKGSAKYKETHINSDLTVPLTSKLVIALILIAALWYII